MRGTGTTEGGLRVGVVGCGFVARTHHLPAIAACGAARVVALADPDARALAAAGALVPSARRHADAGAVLADPEVDLVAVLTPAVAHAELGIAALRAGRHVFVEKPLALTLAEADAMCEAAAEAGDGRVAGVGFALRRHRLVVRAREALRSGALGPLRAIQGTMTSDSASAPERANAWRSDPAAGGGVLLELASHQIDLWRFLTGEEPEDLTALVAPGEATAALHARLGGALASAVVSDEAGRAHELRLCGERATLTARLDRFDGLDLVPATALAGDPAIRLRRAAGIAREAPAMVRSHREGGDLALAMRAQWRDLAAAARGGGAYAPDFADGRAALAAVLGLRAAEAPA